MGLSCLMNPNTICLNGYHLLGETCPHHHEQMIVLILPWWYADCFRWDTTFREDTIFRDTTFILFRIFPGLKRKCCKYFTKAATRLIDNPKLCNGIARRMTRYLKGFPMEKRLKYESWSRLEHFPDIFWIIFRRFDIFRTFIFSDTFWTFAFS